MVQDLARAQRRIEATITALGQLASGQLARIEDREPIDVPEMLDRVARENARPGIGVEITVEADDAGTVWGLACGAAAGRRQPGAQRRHSRRGHPRAAHRRPTGESPITVDDNGRGLPADEHEKVLGRFARAAPRPRVVPGLGLALVAQQAALHGGASNCPTDRSAGCAPG